MRYALVLVVALAGCGDNVKAARDDSGAGSGSDGGTQTALGFCLDRPTHAVAQPGGQLPCELISPGFHPAVSP